MSNAVIECAFRGHALRLIEHNGEPFVVMKPVVEALGLAWQSQHAKLKSASKPWGTTMIVIPSAGGVQETLCLPLRKLPAYTFSIDANRVPQALWPTILAFQKECDEVLWRHWNQRLAPAPLDEPDLEIDAWVAEEPLLAGPAGTPSVAGRLEVVEAELARLEAENTALRFAVLAAKPVWGKLMRCHAAGLSRNEIARALKLDRDRISRDRRTLAACGLLPPVEALAPVEAAHG